MVKYSCTPKEASKSAKAKGCDLRTSFKNTYNVCQAIKGWKLEEAKKYLAAVNEKKRCIPFRRYTGCIGRTPQAKEFKHTQGRWPEKSVKVVQGLLQNAESNALSKMLEPESLVISHIQTHRARQGRRRTYRAHGRINGYMSMPVHIELIVTQADEEVSKSEASTKVVKFTKRQIARRGVTAAN